MGRIRLHMVNHTLAVAGTEAIDRRSQQIPTGGTSRHREILGADRR